MGKLNHCIDNSAGYGIAHDVAQSCEADYHFMNIGAVEVFENGGDKHDQQVRVLIEKYRAHQVADSLKKQILILSQIDGMDVGKRGRVTEHFDVKSPDKVLFEVFRRNVLYGHVGLKGLKLIDYDLVFFLFGLGLTDAFDELLELFG